MPNQTILTVDDEEGVLDVIKDILATKGYNVLTAKNGKDAIKKSRKYTPDLIVMDIMMPDPDGAAVVKQLKEDPATSRIPILFLSGIILKEFNKLVQEVKLGVSFIAPLPIPLMQGNCWLQSTICWKTDWGRQK